MNNPNKSLILTIPHILLSFHSPSYLELTTINQNTIRKAISTIQRKLNIDKNIKSMLTHQPMCMFLFLIFCHSHSFHHIWNHHSMFLHLIHAVDHLSTYLHILHHSHGCKYPCHQLYLVAIPLRKYHHLHGRISLFHVPYCSAIHLKSKYVKN